MELAKVKFPSPDLTLWDLPPPPPRISPPGKLRLLRREEGSRICAQVAPRQVRRYEGEVLQGGVGAPGRVCGFDSAAAETT